MKKGTYIDITGQRFHKVTVRSFHSITKSQGSNWNCVCDCGKEFVTRGVYLRSGRLHSCGCYSAEIAGLSRTTHGLSHTYEYKLWKEAKHRAKKYKRPFNIDITDIIIPDKCPLLNIDIFRGTGKLTINSPSVDCIDPTKGYIKDNIWVISYRANTLKNNFTLDQLKHFSNVIENKIKESFNGNRVT